MRKIPVTPDKHTYSVYVVALSEEPSDFTYRLDTPGKYIHERLNELNLKSDKSAGNVLAYGLIKADYTPEKNDYGYR